MPQRASGGALIETKLHAPALRQEWVPREDLIGHLAGCSSSRLDDLGERPAAAALAGEARQLLTACPDGAQAQWDRLYRLQRQLTRPRPGAAGEPLTERETTVLRLLRGNSSLREIGQELYLSPNTVKTHARAAYRKLGVSSRQDAIARAQETGVL